MYTPANPTFAYTKCVSEGADCTDLLTNYVSFYAEKIEHW